MTYKPSLVIAAEDDLSCSIIYKLISFSGRKFDINRSIITRGNGQLKAGMATFKSASHVFPHVVLTDLDRYPCPLALINDWGATNLPQQLMFRIAVREVEAWLLADRDGIAEFLHIAVKKVPFDPEKERDPKRTLINLARKSRKRRLAQEIIPAPGSSSPIGPLYNTHLVNFVNNNWRIDQAIGRAPSLERMLDRINTFLV